MYRYYTPYSNFKTNLLENIFNINLKSICYEIKCLLMYANKLLFILLISNYLYIRYIITFIEFSRIDMVILLYLKRTIGNN